MEALERRLGRALARAITDFDLIADGDRIMVAVSGGKDSYTMLHLLRELQRRAPIQFELKVVNVDQGHPGYPGHLLREYMAREAYDFTMIEEDTYSIVTEKIPAGKTYCSLCSRLRRVLQTLLLNLLFAGQLASMPPRLVADDGAHVVIRPLVYCAEEDIRAFSDAVAFPILPCDLCGSQEQLQRKRVGRLIDDLEADRPGTKAVMLAALQNVRPSQLLDRRLWNALGMHGAREDEETAVRDGAVIAEQRLVRGALG